LEAGSPKKKKKKNTSKIVKERFVSKELHLAVGSVNLKIKILQSWVFISRIVRKKKEKRGVLDIFAEASRGGCVGSSCSKGGAVKGDEIEDSKRVKGVEKRTMVQTP